MYLYFLNVFVFNKYKNKFPEFPSGRKIEATFLVVK